MNKFLFNIYLTLALLAGILSFSEAAAQQVRNRPASRNTAAAASDISHDPVKADSTPRRQSSAWTLEMPLGEHKPAIVDTLRYNYQQKSIPSMTSDAYATTGTLGAEGINMIYFERPQMSAFYFDHSLHYILPTNDKMKFYNVYVPMTLLSYNLGGGKQNHQDRLNAIFAGNVNRNIGIGAFIDYNYQKGAYNYQSVKDLTWGAAFYFNSHRYEGQIYYNHFNDLNMENGGITDDLYITDPAEVQGGVDHIEAKSIPTRLSNARNRIRGDHLFTTHALKLGYWTEEQVNDTLTRDLYIPVTKFVYSLDYESRNHNFTNTNATQGHEFWENSYLDPSRTNDHTVYWSVKNTIGIQLLEGFRKWAKFGIAAYATLENRRFTMTNFKWLPELTEEQAAELTPLPAGFQINSRENQTRLFAGGSISKRQGSLLTYAANVRFGLAGDVAGDIDAYGNIETRFKLFGDTVDISAHGGFHNNENPYLLQHYISNHFVWNQNLGKTRRFEVGGKLVIPWTRTTFSADFRNTQNFVYFNSVCLPTQHSGNVQVFALRLDQKLKFGIWNWNNTITYQVSSDQNVLPLPALAVYSNMFLDFTAFRVLKLQIGVDCDYYTAYYGYKYQPATMSFCVQQDTKVGNYPFCNVYVNAKLYKVRFYVLYSHVNQGWFGKNYFSLPGYPLNPRCFQLGLCVDFAN